MQVFSSDAGPTLVSAVELISPRNKDRPQSRRAFAAKCVAYLQRGIGLVVVDVVTSRRANLHNELVRIMDLADDQYVLPDDHLSANAYRPVVRDSGEQIDIWYRALTVGAPLPELPLPLDKGICVRLDLEETYEKACTRSRLPS